MKKKPTVVAVHPAGEDHQVISLQGDGGYRRSPCEQCPWRRDQAGSFPAEAFRVSANTAYDLSEHTFACHMSGAEHPATCAGFLMRGADHNLAIRFKYTTGKIPFDDISDGGADLFGSYREMAVANGVDPDDPVLAPCRD
jgi:hypothetical protein